MKRLAATLAAAVAAAATQPACAQVVVHDAKLGTFVPYGIDRELVRLDKIERVARIDGRPYVRDQSAGDGHVGYIIITLTLRNARNATGYLPAFVTTVTAGDGPAIDPALYGPFIGKATRQADPATKIPPHAQLTLHLAALDIPNGQPVREIQLSPNDATIAYRFTVHPNQIRDIAQIPR